MSELADGARGEATDAVLLLSRPQRRVRRRHRGRLPRLPRAGDGAGRRASTIPSRPSASWPASPSSSTAAAATWCCCCSSCGPSAMPSPRSCWRRSRTVTAPLRAELVARLKAGIERKVGGALRPGARGRSGARRPRRRAGAGSDPPAPRRRRGRRAVARARALAPARHQAEAKQEQAHEHRPASRCGSCGSPASQEEMGRRHGELLAAAGGADAVIRHYQDMPARLVAGDGPPAVRAVALAAMRGLSEVLLARLAADRPAELRGRSRAFMSRARPSRARRSLPRCDGPVPELRRDRGALGPGPVQEAGAARDVGGGAAGVLDGDGVGRRQRRRRAPPRPQLRLPRRRGVGRLAGGGAVRARPLASATASSPPAAPTPRWSRCGTRPAW